MKFNVKFRVTIAISLVLVAQVSTPSRAAAQDTTPALGVTVPPNSWIDRTTNHRVIQLTVEPNSRGLYFNENAFTPDGTQMVYLAGHSVNVVDMTTYKSRQLVPSPVNEIVVGHKSPTVYFTRPDDSGLYVANVNSGQIQKIADLPPNAIISSLNADETLAAGAYVEGNGLDKLKHAPDPNLKASSIRATAMEERLAAHLPMVLFTFNLHTGEIRKVLHSTDWINHVQFSPKDPNLLMYCHEGLWWKVDRIWTVRADGSHNELIHKRTVNGEIAGHEFWDADGVTIWYDLQIPRGQNFYLASFNTDTGARHWYSVERDAWSIHYNAASDDSIFCGDGGDYAQVAKSKNGQWIELFSPRESPVPTEIDQTGLTQSGFFVTQHLVNLASHNYTLEPNVRFSPDHRLVIFTSNMFGPSYVYAVEVAHAKPVATP